MSTCVGGPQNPGGVAGIARDLQPENDGSVNAKSQRSEAATHGPRDVPARSGWERAHAFK